MASVSLYVFMIAWNEFLLAFMLLDDAVEIHALTRGIASLNSSEIPRQHLMAGVGDRHRADPGDLSLALRALHDQGADRRVSERMTSTEAMDARARDILAAERQGRLHGPDRRALSLPVELGLHVRAALGLCHLRPGPGLAPRCETLFSRRNGPTRHGAPHHLSRRCDPGYFPGPGCLGQAGNGRNGPPRGSASRPWPPALPPPTRWDPANPAGRRRAQLFPKLRRLAPLVAPTVRCPERPA